MVLVHEQYELNHALWTAHYLTYKAQVVGFCAPRKDLGAIRDVAGYLDAHKRALRAFVAATSIKLFTQHATTLSGTDIFALPYPESHQLKLTPHEEILVADIVDHYGDLVRLGEDSAAMKLAGARALNGFNELFTDRIKGVYKRNKLKVLSPLISEGLICQPYAFGSANVEWPEKTEEQQLKLDRLLHEKRGGGLSVTRIARIYDGACIFLIKPDRLRYWLRSVALRDADETLADLNHQGF